MAHVTKKTLRYYDSHNILKPSFIADNGTKYYSDKDLAILQQILFLKYLSFPLADIKELTIRASDQEFWLDSFRMQTNLLDEQINQMYLMKSSIEEAKKAILENRDVNWSELFLLSNSNEMEQKLKTQYLNSSNISSRIQLHNEYSKNSEGWFPWLFRLSNIKSKEKVLDLGCGDASFWKQNIEHIPSHLHVLVTDISEGIVREVAKQFSYMDHIFKFQVMDAQKIDLDDESMDIVLANHMLFYCDDLEQVLSEIKRVLKPNGRLICSTYSNRHMQEVSTLVKEFDNRILLSANNLFEKFGKDNGYSILSKYFSKIEWVQYEDQLLITKPEPLISYILSCHGNQNRIIVDKYHEFYSFVEKRTLSGFTITKDAGVFIALKN